MLIRLNKLTLKKGGEVLLKFKDVVSNNLQVINEINADFVEKMYGSMMKSMFRELDEVCENVGNVVNAKNFKSNSEAFLEMLRKIEFGVGRDGKPSLPSIHASPQMVDALLKELSSNGPEFNAEVERIKEQKIKAALEKERQRQARFVFYPKPK